MKTARAWLCFFLLAGIFPCHAGKPLGLGDDAPGFLLYDQEGFAHSVSQHRGKFVFLFFFPRVDVFSSAREIRMVQKLFNEFYDRDIVVYGINQGSVKNHKKLHNKMRLAFDLLSDPEGKIAEAYGAKGLIFLRPLSYLIGPDGRIFRCYERKGSKSLPVKALEDIYKMEARGEKFSI